MTNPMMMKGPLRETIPAGPFAVRIRLPPGTRATKAQLLTAGTAIPAETTNGVLRVTVPSVATHEVIAIDF
jgi:hypothetical protein